MDAPPLTEDELNNLYAWVLNDLINNSIPPRLTKYHYLGLRKTYQEILPMDV
jgi:hypothetical protein